MHSAHETLLSRFSKQPLLSVGKSLTSHHGTHLNRRAPWEWRTKIPGLGWGVEVRNPSIRGWSSLEWGCDYGGNGSWLRPNIPEKLQGTALEESSVPCLLTLGLGQLGTSWDVTSPYFCVCISKIRMRTKSVRVANALVNWVLIKRLQQHVTEQSMCNRVFLIALLTLAVMSIML